MRAALLTLAAAFTLAAAGCAMRPESLERSAGPLVLERDFAGRSYASGSFASSITGLRRDFKVTLDGARKGETFVLSERFNYADGEKGVKTWRFRKLGEGRYDGTREDVVGFAEVTKDGTAIRLSYDVELPSSSGATRVHFEDVLGRSEDGNIVNRAAVSKFGLLVGVVDLRFSRHPL